MLDEAGKCLSSAPARPVEVEPLSRASLPLARVAHRVKHRGLASAGLFRDGSLGLSRLPHHRFEKLRASDRAGDCIGCTGCGGCGGCTDCTGGAGGTGCGAGAAVSGTVGVATSPVQSTTVATGVDALLWAAGLQRTSLSVCVGPCSWLRLRSKARRPPTRPAERCKQSFTTCSRAKAVAAPSIPTGLPLTTPSASAGT